MTSDPTGIQIKDTVLDSDFKMDSDFTHTTVFNLNKRRYPFQSVTQLLRVFGLLASQDNLFKNIIEDTTLLTYL
jgi:hypothetical protein